MGQHLTSWKERNGHIVKIISIGVVVSTIIGIGIYFYYDLKEESEEIEESLVPVVVTKEEEIKEEDVVTKKGWMVDIKGEVNIPGTYAVSEEMRIIDVIYLAGDLTTKADTSLLNLSKKVEDQMVIIIYSKEEVTKMKETLDRENDLNNLCLQQEILKNDACITDNDSSNIKVNINTATKEELLTLSGIGEAKALAIIKYREEKKFDSIDELIGVDGIGESIFAAIKDYITVE